MRTLVPVLVALAATLGCQRSTDRFYATAEGGAKIIQIEIQGDHQISTKVIGPTGIPGCASLALSAAGTLYSMCGPGVAAPGPQQLSIIDMQTGHANPVGATVTGLTVMGLEFSPDGNLYAVGDSDSKSPAFNSLYLVDVKTGAFTRVGPTGAPAFFMDFAFDRQGTLYGATSIALYRIDVKTAKAAKLADFTGSTSVMGLAFNRDATKLYATDFKTPISDLFLVDAHSGALTRVASTGFANSHNLVLIRQ
jgi:DNA-binding beta-propeller fold protein YncE